MNDPRYIIPDDEQKYTSDTTAAKAREEHRISIKKKKRRRKLLVSSGGIVFITLVFFLVIFLFAFKVNTVTVEGNVLYSSDEIISGAGISTFSNFFLVSERSVTSSLAESYPAVRDVTVEKKFPSTVNIRITESDPFFYLTIGSFTYILDDKLVVHRTAESIGEAESMNLREIRVSGVKECIAGKRIEADDKDFVDMFGILYEQLCINELISDVTSIDMSDKFDIRFTLGSEYTIKIGNILECENKIGFVKKFLPQIVSLDVHTIDITDENVQKVIVSKR